MSKDTEQNNGNGASKPNGSGNRTFLLQQLYVKDLSFEEIKRYDM